MVFTLASAGAGLATEPAMLFTIRAVQGLGAAFAVPAAMAILTAVYRQQREREAALGYLSATMDVAMVAGLLLGGVLTATLGWPWCFFIAVPVGLAAAAFAPVALPESRDDEARTFDVRGAILAIAGFSALSLGIVQLQHRDTTGWPLLGVAAVLLGAFGWAEHRSAAPMVRLSIFRHRPLRGANLAISANAGAFGSLLFLTTLYLQQTLGYDALHTGLAYVPLAVSAAIGGIVAPSVIRVAGSRWTAVGSLLVTAAVFLLLSQAGGRTILVLAFLVSGFTFAAAFVPLTAQAMTGVRDGEKGLASGLVQTSTHLGGALVLTILATAATLSSGQSLAYMLGAALLVLGALAARTTLPKE